MSFFKKRKNQNNNNNQPGPVENGTLINCYTDYNKNYTLTTFIKK